MTMTTTFDDASFDSAGSGMTIPLAVCNTMTTQIQLVFWSGLTNLQLPSAFRFCRCHNVRTAISDALANLGVRLIDITVGNSSSAAAAVTVVVSSSNSVS